MDEKNIGLPPGTPVYVGDSPELALDISIIRYDAGFAEMRDRLSVDDLAPAAKISTVQWININGLNNIETIKAIAKKYNIHSLTVEDILDTKQQPKAETFENYSFISFKSIRREKGFTHNQEKKKGLFDFGRRKRKNRPDFEEEFLIEQISMVMTQNTIITFQEQIPGDPFREVRKRIAGNSGIIRRMNATYLAYSLIDAVVDEYYLTLAHLEEDIENFEDRAVKTNDDSFFTEIQETKKYLLQIKHAMIPLRDIFLSANRQDLAIKNDELKPYMQDLRDHLNEAISTLENYREWLTNILDVNLSYLSHQMNKVMKTLAIISSIFIPLTFIAGVYGMNFQYMPELGFQWAYPIVMLGMGFIASMMIIFFKVRRWF